jgi:hypothetical protein
VQGLLIARALGTSANLNPLQSWPVYAPTEPGTPDDVITVTTTAGITHGRNHVDGEMSEHYGLSIRIRSTVEEEGHDKANEIATELNEDVYKVIISLSSSAYCIHSIRTTTSVLYIGYETPTSKRHVHIVNCLADIRQLA